MIGRGLHPLLPRPVPGPRPAPILSADRDGQGHRGHGAPPPGAYPRAPTQCVRRLSPCGFGRSSPPSRGCWRDGAGAPSSSRQRRSFVGTESSRGANGGAGDPLVALVGRPCLLNSSSSSSGSPERTGAGAVSASRVSFEVSAFASRRARSGAPFADTASALLPAVAVMAAVSRRGGQGHPRHGLVHRRHRVLHPALRALRHRVEESSGAHPQDHRSGGSGCRTCRRGRRLPRWREQMLTSSLRVSIHVP